jgi:CheY-like chemotaxis protein
MKILVVEDEPLIRLGLVSVLEEAGFVVLEAPHADGAIRLLEADTSIRMVVTDVDMPGSMDGIKLAHYVRQKWPPIALVVISGKIGVKQGELPAGARFMGKPYQEAALVGLLKSMMPPEGDQA